MGDVGSVQGCAYAGAGAIWELSVTPLDSAENLKQAIKNKAFKREQNVSSYICIKLWIKFNLTLSN